MLKTTYNADLQTLTTFGIPAKCGRLVEFDTIDDLRSAYRQGLLKGAFVLGGGSNVLFSNGSYDGTVVHPVGRNYKLRTLSPGTVSLEVDAGMTLDEVCRITAEAGLWGLENLSGIPGTVGGAAVQNAGAYGAEFADAVVSVQVFHASDAGGKLVEYPVEECRYGYRTSMFKKPDHHAAGWHTDIICSVKLRLSFTPRPRLEYAGLKEMLGEIPSARLHPALVRRAVLSLRSGKLPDPARVGSAGSFFQNPVVTQRMLEKARRKWQEALDTGKVAPKLLDEADEIPFHALSGNHFKLSAAWLIDHAGCKPMTEGGAGLWPGQPLVLVNREGGATARDITELERRVVERVKSIFGITLHPEVVHIP